MVIRCFVPGCGKNTRNSSGLSFFKPPKNLINAERILTQLKVNSEEWGLKHLRICGNHFITDSILFDGK